MAKASDKPDAPALQEALRKWEAGDVLRARMLAQEVLAHGPTEKDAALARELLTRAALPRLGLLLLGIAAVLITLMAVLGAYRT